MPIRLRKVFYTLLMPIQDTWHKDQLAFDEDQLQNLSTMLVGTSYCECLVRMIHIPGDDLRMS